jgi:hypothetical protein
VKEKSQKTQKRRESSKNFPHSKNMFRLVLIKSIKESGASGMFGNPPISLKDVKIMGTVVQK